MKCPLINEQTQYPSGQWMTETLDCLKEECAWWFEETYKCGLLELASATCAVAQHLSVIREYGPGGEQA